MITKQNVIQFYESGVLETGTVYQYAHQAGNANGGFAERKSTSSNHIRGSSTYGNDTGESNQGYIYFYNLGDSSKYSFATSHQMANNQNLIGAMNFQSGVLPQTSTVDGIRFIFTNTTKLFGSYDISLYGIRYS